MLVDNNLACSVIRFDFTDDVRLTSTNLALLVLGVILLSMDIVLVMVVVKSLKGTCTPSYMDLSIILCVSYKNVASLINLTLY